MPIKVAKGLGIPAAVVNWVTHRETITPSELIREFKTSQNDTKVLIEKLEEAGVIGPKEGVKPRRVLVSAAKPPERQEPILVESNGDIDLEPLDEDEVEAKTEADDEAEVEDEVVEETPVMDPASAEIMRFLNANTPA